MRPHMFKGPLPIRIHHRRLASDNAKLEGTIPLARFERLIELLENDAGDVQVKLEFRPGHKRRTRIIGQFDFSAAMVCQSCMEPVTLGLVGEVRLMIVNSEAELEALDEEDDGLICSEDQLLLADLLEDDLILSLPMVSRHAEGECPSDGVSMLLASRAAMDLDQDQRQAENPTKETYRPFAGLADLTEGLFKKH